MEKLKKAVADNQEILTLVIQLALCVGFVLAGAGKAFGGKKKK